MSTYRVTVIRTEEIAFDIEAESSEDAEDRYLRDGDEVFSETVTTAVVDVEEIKP